MLNSVYRIPSPPAGIPETLQEQWKDAYSKSFESALAAFPDHAAAAPDAVTAWIGQQKQAALTEANKLLLTPKLTSYKQAMSLEQWHFILREPSLDGKTLRVVTRHGDKYLFPVER